MERAEGGRPGGQGSMAQVGDKAREAWQWARPREPASSVSGCFLVWGWRCPWNEQLHHG
jgi:hypothetical protein